MNTFEHSSHPYQDKEQTDSTKRIVQFIDTEVQNNKKAPTIYTFRDLYSKKGEDLLAYYEKQAHTRKKEKIQNDFFHNIEHGVASQLAEKLPLLANQKGRLGEYVEAKVTKTLKQDDQGNSFIDLVIEMTNDYAGEVDEESPRKMTLLVDVGTNVGDKKKDKEYALQKEFLDKALKANVKCYSDGFGLGIERPKIMVTQEGDFMKKVGERLGSLVTQHASDSFSITNDEKFNKEYREYFKDLMRAVRENAIANIHYIVDVKGFNDKYHRALVVEYEKIAHFAAAYEKTPTHRVQRGTDNGRGQGL